ncbi:MAG: hypothetical protein IKE85_08315 [Mogibacterium sp.]|nr:hypothetical protein [Mogibacterium sp.]MBR2540804.1 hypothetical protein [Mogibacterium sp.]
MLGKLLKYEIPALGRKLIPLYIGWAATAVLLGLAIGPAQSKSEFAVVMTALLYSGVATAVVVMAIVMIVQRYSNSLLGDGGYFSHVLPVTTTEHIASKTITAAIWVLLSGVAMVITGFIIALAAGQIRYIQFFGLKELGLYWANVLEFILASILNLTKSILAIYAALTIGHLAKQHTTLASIGAYIGLLWFEAVIARIVFLPMIDLANEVITEHEFDILVLEVGIVSLVLGGIYFFICKYLLDKKLNLA